MGTCVLTRGNFYMIPENLKESWQKVLARCELMFLADNGGGYPDCLAGLSQRSRRAPCAAWGSGSRSFTRCPLTLTRPEAPDNLEPWIRLTSGVGVSLNHGFVSRAGRGSCMGEGTVQFRRKKAFATLYREVAQDERLSLESQGPAGPHGLPLPEDWEYSVSGLAKKAGCGKDKLRRILGSWRK